MSATFSEAEEQLYRLAPLSFENFRPHRYRGDGVCISLATLAQNDRQRVHTLYACLLELREKFTQSRDGAGSQCVAEFLGIQRRSELLQLAQGLGRESFAANSSPEMARAIHDLRGGGLTPLVGLLQLAERRGFTEKSINSAYYLTRDHLKIMRNVLPDLDAARHTEDLRLKAHSTNLIVEKWQNTVWHEERRQTQIVVDCATATNISSCCLESGALDRILYSLLGNACRHTGTSPVRLTIFPVPDAAGNDIRFVVVNQLSAPESDRFSNMDLGQLFIQPPANIGERTGLAVVIEEVSLAYGLEDRMQAVLQGYAGVALLDGAFAAWFHWPRA